MSRETDRALAGLGGLLVFGPAGKIFAENAYDRAHPKRSQHKNSENAAPRKSSAPYESYQDKLKSYEELASKRKPRTSEFDAMGTTGARYHADGGEQSLGSMAEALEYLKDNHLPNKVHHYMGGAGGNSSLTQSAFELNKLEWTQRANAKQREKPAEMDSRSEAFHASPLEAMQEMAAQRKTVEDEFFDKLGTFLSVLESSRLVTIAYLQAALHSPDHPHSAYLLDREPLKDYNIDDRRQREKDLLVLVKSIDDKKAILDKLAPLWMKHSGKDHIPVHDANGHEITDPKDYAPFNRASHFEGITLLEEDDRVIENRGTTREVITGKIAALLETPRALAEEITSDMSHRYSTGNVETTLIYLEKYSGLSRDAQRGKLEALKAALEERLDAMTQPDAAGTFKDSQIQRARNAIEMVTDIGLRGLDKEPAVAQTTSRGRS